MMSEFEELTQIALIYKGKDPTEETLEILSKVYELEYAGQEQEASIVLMTFIVKCAVNLHGASKHKLNTLFSFVDVRLLKTRSLVGLIRSTAIIREEIYFWDVVYEEVRARLYQLDKDPSKLFVGLNKT